MLLCLAITRQQGGPTGLLHWENSEVPTGPELLGRVVDSVSRLTGRARLMQKRRLLWRK